MPLKLTCAFLKMNVDKVHSFILTLKLFCYNLLLLLDMPSKQYFHKYMDEENVNLMQKYLLLTKKYEEEELGGSLWCFELNHNKFIVPVWAVMFTGVKLLDNTLREQTSDQRPSSAQTYLQQIFTVRYFTLGQSRRRYSQTPHACMYMSFLVMKTPLPPKLLIKLKLI